MAAVTIIKNHSDVHISDIIKSLAINGKASVNLLTQGADETVKSVLLYSLDEAIDAGFDENSSVYGNLEAMLEVDGFTGPVQVISFPNKDVPDINSVAVAPTSDGASVTATTVPGIVRALEDHLLDGAYWNVLISEDLPTIEAAADFLYANQKGLLVAQVSKIADLQALDTYAAGKYTEKNKLNSLVTPIMKDSTKLVGAQSAAYATLNLLLDWMHIGNLSQFEPDDWTPSEIDQILKAHGLTVLNKAGDDMLSGSTLSGGGYIDNTFNAQYDHNAVETSVQKWLNGKKFANFDDATIAELVASIDAQMVSLGAQGLIDKKLDGKPDYKIVSVKRADIPNADVVSRSLRGISVKYTLPNPFEQVYMQDTVTL